MERASEKGELLGVTFTVYRENRMGQAQRGILYNDLVGAVRGFNEEGNRLPLRVEDAEIYVLLASNSCEIISDDPAWNIPAFHVPIAQHVNAVTLWMDTEPSIGNAISAAFDRINAPLVPRPILPASEHTEAEKADPNFLDEGKTTKKG